LPLLSKQEEPLHVCCSWDSPLIRSSLELRYYDFLLGSMRMRFRVDAHALPVPFKSPRVVLPNLFRIIRNRIKRESDWYLHWIACKKHIAKMPKITLRD
jgi:hypothetical protein